ncbi:GNAT family N-acetyltransferase [Chroogloeocystis siderophila]|uniref:GNAT family N-acetyltransferase n=1 Tax=Chroogloeocystis siderophila 5.2 s.c.1 TaxID=247279 RepID=A0A1U7HK33_9CHRO|nr:GNAT family N-acetyltransferase [Chroogloeocystis siderophila]OKH23946.1 GNAT family N-acetyltransferase [Chroogloeocystis siderophila 5.2 s.c.1]
MQQELPPGCSVRPAAKNDLWAIRKLVLSAKLDPTQLNWSQFWVIECHQKIVACGQLRNFNTVQELGSLVVSPAWRDRGLGSYLINHLIAQATQPLYLECVGNRLALYYTRFGFVPISWQALPQSLKLKFGISQLAAVLIPFLTVTIMQYQGNAREQAVIATQ